MDRDDDEAFRPKGFDLPFLTLQHSPQTLLQGTRRNLPQWSPRLFDIGPTPAVVTQRLHLPVENIVGEKSALDMEDINGYNMI